VKRPAYPLTTVQRHRESTKKEMMERLAHRIHIVTMEKQRLVDAENAHSEAIRFLQETERCLGSFDATTPVQANELIRLSEDIDALRKRVARKRREVEKKEDDVAGAERAADDARRDLAIATREVQVIDRHYARWLANWSAEHQREQEKDMQDIAISGWIRNRGLGDVQ